MTAKATKTAATNTAATNAAASPPQLPAIAPPGLGAYVDSRVITAADVAAAARLVSLARGDGSLPQPDLHAWIAMCLALRASRDGHTCVPLDDVAWRAADVDPAEAARLEWPARAEEWIEALASAGPLVGSPGDRVPFILAGTRLYLARTLHEEEEIARRLVAAGDRLEILLGGPGTGKTTQVAIRLVDLFRANPGLHVALAAPTGKAAARMAEALRQRLSDPKAPPEVRNAPEEVRAAIAAAHPTTIHKLLEYRPRGTPRYQVNATHLLAHDLVVVDEASMLSSSLTHHLLAAVGEDTKLLLVGDPDQLASVDAGSVLGDVAKAARRPGSRLAGRATTLTVRHRFGVRIGALADAILLGERGTGGVFEILSGRWNHVPDSRNETPDDPDSVCWVEPGSAACRRLFRQVVEHARGVRELARAGGVDEALAAQRRLQLLCAHRSGSLGVAGMNALVERGLGIPAGTRWYSGRPVMVSANNNALRLHNGDVGLVVPGPAGRQKDAVFPLGEELRKLPVSRLEDVDTVHALTIHKSQGSEYGHAIVVLPEKPSRILTTELLYTGVTRAKDRVTVVGSREVIEHAIKTPIRRATGLEDRLR